MLPNAKANIAQVNGANVKVNVRVIVAPFNRYSRILEIVRTGSSRINNLEPIKLLPQTENRVARLIDYRAARHCSAPGLVERQRLTCLS